jgi:hypothetical protein
MKQVVAIGGAIIVFVGVCVVTGFLFGFLVPILVQRRIGVGMLYTNNPVGLILGAFAALHSYRSSLRGGRRK